MSTYIECKVSNPYYSEYGQILLKDINKTLRQFEIDAKEYQKTYNFDHVIYAHKIYDETDKLEKIHFYTKLGLSDEEFEKRTSAVKGIIYAIHKR